QLCFGVASQRKKVRQFFFAVPARNARGWPSRRHAIFSAGLCTSIEPQHVLWQNSQEFGAGSSKRRPREPTKIQFESAQDLRRSPPKTSQGNSNPNPRRDRDRQKTQ